MGEHLELLVHGTRSPRSLLRPQYLAQHLGNEKSLVSIWWVSVGINRQINNNSCIIIKVMGLEGRQT